jgi:hypothetical protein
MLSKACLLLLTFPLAQPGDLEVSNARGTYGYLGAKRPPTGILPGDMLFFAFELKGLKVDAKGKASYSLLTEVINDKDEVIFKEGPRNAVAQSILGGDSLPCAAHLEVPTTTPPGAYTLRVTITDRTTDKKAVFEKKGKVLNPGFGLVRVGLSADPAGHVPSPPVGVVGQTVYLNFSVIGFKAGKESKQPKLHANLRILDDKGKSTLADPIEGDITEAAEGSKLVPIHYGMTLSRTGEFQIELTVTDKLANKSAKVTFPLKVVAVK